MFKKKTIAKCMAIVLMLSSIPTNILAAQKSSTKFNDIKGNWAEKYINEFVNQGIISGYDDGTFRPSNNVTRAEFVTTVNKTFGFTEKSDKSFKDIKEGSWYYDDVLIAVNQGYINGYEDNTFRPNEKITREEACKIIGSILNVSGDGHTNFKDEKNISNWAIKYVDGLVDMGVINGYEDGTFKPKNNSTRAESVKVLKTAKDVKVNSEKPLEESKPQKPNNDNSSGNTESDVIIPPYNNEEPPIINPTPPDKPTDPPVINPIPPDNPTSPPTIDPENPNEDLLDFNNPKWDKDSDNDGVCDAEEEIYGSDPQSLDGDNDGLLDYFEVNELLSNAKSIDTDNDGITDDKEDFDLDGLTNLEEQNLKTNPLNNDTDIDGLSDNDEVNKYKTNPLNDDTDNDGLYDGLEIKLGINPNKKDSDNNGIDDNEESFDITYSCAEISKDEELEIGIVGNIKAKYINDIKITNMEFSHDYITEDIEGYIGAPYELSFGDNISLDNIKIQFKIYSETIKSKNITNPIIYGFNEDTNSLEKMNSTYKTDNDGNMYVEVNPLSKYNTYVVLDSYKAKNLNENIVPLAMVNGGKVQVDDGLLLKAADASYSDLTGRINKTTKGMYILKDKNVPRDDLDSLKIVYSNDPTETMEGRFGATAFLIGNRLIVAYAGTKFNSQDTIDDINLAFGQTAQVKIAISFLEDTLEELRKDGTVVKNIYITGHSLGGYLAQNVFYRCENGTIKTDIEKDRLKGAIFNSAPIYFADAVKYTDNNDIRHAIMDITGPDFVREDVKNANKKLFESNQFWSDKYDNLRSYHICGDSLAEDTLFDRQTFGVNPIHDGKLITKKSKMFKYDDNCHPIDGQSLCDNLIHIAIDGLLREHGIKNFYKDFYPSKFVRLDGTLVDENSEAIKDVTVEIRSLKGHVFREVHTNKYGNFSTDVKQGKYRIIFTKEGYKTQVIDINLDEDKKLPHIILEHFDGNIDLKTSTGKVFIFNEDYIDGEDIDGVKLLFESDLSETQENEKTTIDIKVSPEDSYNDGRINLNKLKSLEISYNLGKYLGLDAIKINGEYLAGVENAKPGQIVRIIFDVEKLDKIIKNDDELDITLYDDKIRSTLTGDMRNFTLREAEYLYDIVTLEKTEIIGEVKVEKPILVDGRVLIEENYKEKAILNVTKQLDVDYGKPKITGIGSGKILLDGGILKVDSLYDLAIDVEMINKDSEIYICNQLLSGEGFDAIINNSESNITMSPDTTIKGISHSITFDKNIVLNKNTLQDDVVFKASGPGATIDLNGNSAYIFGLNNNKKVTGGKYIFTEKKVWEKVEFVTDGKLSGNITNEEVQAEFKENDVVSILPGSQINETIELPNDNNVLLINGSVKINDSKTVNIVGKGYISLEKNSKIYINDLNNIQTGIYDTRGPRPESRINPGQIKIKEKDLLGEEDAIITSIYEGYIIGISAVPNDGTRTMQVIGELGFNKDFTDVKLIGYKYAVINLKDGVKLNFDTPDESGSRKYRWWNNNYWKALDETDSLANIIDKTTKSTIFK